MDYTSIPIIVVCCYIVGEVYKIIFRNHKEAYKYIPTVMAIVGGILGVLIYYTAIEIMDNVDNVWVALVVGITSGVECTGTNQIIKQLFKKDEEYDNKEKY